MSTVESRLRERIAHLEEELRQARAAMGAECDPFAAIGITGQQGIALAVMMRGGTKTRDAIESAIEMARPTKDGRDCRHFDVVMTRLRTRLRPHGVTIRSIYGQGYTIDAENRGRVHALCAAGARIACPPRAPAGRGENRT